ncbi:cytidylyltransferase domain-containing protein [Enterocloster bolteae]|uniref:acylneuraminate cytidylyltransferase family protein n=1 Tax=Enterocloster bolteae TaxID=208479 RepID=UPI0018A10469|nr:acylneuraminate cytidylyltransferase family protein [Enterocloster bolteae]
MRNIIVIPARGGSKGIPKKNIYPINGKPLLEYTLDVIADAELPNTDVVVSTDSEEIKQVALKYANVCVIDRPHSISGDTASTEDALLHAIDVMEDMTGLSYDAVLTMQPTSPLRRKETLREFIKTFEQSLPNFDAMLSLSETRGDYWIYNENGKYERLFKDAPRRRQDRKPMYIENSAYYITLVNSLKQTHSVLGNRVNGYVIPEVEGIDINEPSDILIAQIYLGQEKVNNE